MKKVEFELTNSVHKRWLEYKKKTGYEHDSGALYELLTRTISEKKILDLAYEAADCVIPRDGLTDEQQDILLNVTYYLCNCDVCEEKGGHTDTKRHEIAVSRKHFDTMLKPHVPIGLLDIIGHFVHEITHNLYPSYDENAVIEKTAELWIKGMTKISQSIKGLNNNHY